MRGHPGQGPLVIAFIFSAYDRIMEMLDYIQDDHEMQVNMRNVSFMKGKSTCPNMVMDIRLNNPPQINKQQHHQQQLFNKA